MRQLTCCCFDLETSNLDADFGIVLCAVVKPQGKRARVFRGDAYWDTWPLHRSDDRPILSDICAELEKYDIWCAHNGRDLADQSFRTQPGPQPHNYDVASTFEEQMAKVFRRRRVRPVTCPSCGKVVRFLVYEDCRCTK